MKRGSYGKPHRPPADGWAVPRKVYFGGLYQHLRPALNGKAKLVNNTSVATSSSTTGTPATRTTAGDTTGCESHPSTTLPQIPWIGLADNQGLPAALGGSLNNTYAQSGTIDLGAIGRRRGFKNVQAVRQWHGALPWTSHDYTACANVCCPTGSRDAGTFASSSFEPPQTSAAQTKYLAYSIGATLAVSMKMPGDGTQGTISIACSASGGKSVNAQSGLLTSSLSTRETYTETLTNVDPNVTVVTYECTNGAGTYRYGDGTAYNAFTHGGATAIDPVVGFDAHCAHVTCPDVNFGWVGEGVALNDIIGTWNSDWPLAEGAFVSASKLPEITNLNSYSGTASKVTTNMYGNVTRTISISWSRSDTVYRWDVSYSEDNLSPDAGGTYEFHGTATLSSPNTSAAVLSDIMSLLGHWDLSDDAQYPPRTDGFWQLAPLVARDEPEDDISPIAWNTFIVDDLRSPIADANGNAPWTTPASPAPTGWTTNATNHDGSGLPSTDPNYSGAVAWNPTYSQIAWFDENAYGFIFPTGRDSGNSPASGLVQFARTGLILGMPLPAALSNASSYWYQSGFAAASGAAYQDFFDFSAEVWKACTNETDGGTYVDFYLAGYGEWTSGVISRTGAQLPLCATHWTHNFDAMRLPPYAWLIQGDKQTYDQNGQPGSESDFTAHRGDALWAQKCCEIQEIWPSQDFARPGGADRFAPDEKAVYCISSWSGTTITFTDDPANIVQGDLIGVDNNGYTGVFTAGTVDHANFTIALGMQQYPLPTGFELPSGDTATSVWKLRWPTAPAILGRAAVASLAAATTGSTTITLAAAQVNLMTGDTIDLCSTAITYDSSGNVVTETMTAVQSNVAVTRVDDLHFTVPVAIGSLTGVAYIVSHGAPNWYWDDNGRKGDFAAFQWVYDYRTNGEVSRLAGVTDCSSNTPPSGSPTANNGYASFSAIAGALPFKPCCYGVIAITPNGETFQNGYVIPFPTTFNFDDRYGARWQGEIEQAMADLLWQSPHSPCGSSLGWSMDDGTCEADTDTTQFYEHYPFVETRLSLPTNGGDSQTETAPSLPTGITIGYGTPVTYPALTNALYPPGTIGFDPSSGNPSAAWTIWGYRQSIESNACFGGCRFDYVGAENLACVKSYPET